MGDKSVQNILASIGDSRVRPLARVIFALGIRHVGAETAELLAGNFNSVDALATASEDDLMRVPTIGPKIAASIIAFFRNEENRQLIQKLRKAGVKLEQKVKEKGDLPLSGKEFVLTGKLEGLTRGDAEARIKALGGSVGSSVTRKTTHLVVGGDPGSKLDKARKLGGIEELNEEQFIRLIQGSS
jgi:DNA ligase (NAD+)